MSNQMFKSTAALERGLSASSLRNQVISNNIANAETPGFKASEVTFESVFKEAVENGSSFVAKRTREKHIDFSQNNLDNLKATVTTDTSTTQRLDGNNVDIDSENVELAKNTIFYNTLVQKVSSEFSKLRSAIDGR